MARVPKAGAGAGRRAYHSAYAKGTRSVVNKATGGLSVSTPQGKPLTAPRGGNRKTDYNKAAGDFNVSYGTTGFTEEDYNV